MKKAILILLIICGVGVFAEKAAGAVTVTYEFVTEQSTVTATARRSVERSLSGQFQLTFDLYTGRASIDWSDATLDSEIGYMHFPQQRFLVTSELNELFLLTELDSTSVTSDQIDFLFEKNITSFPGADIYLFITFEKDGVNLTGYFGEPVYDGY